MPCTASAVDTVRPAAWWNDQIRAFTAGRTAWSPEALTELAKLRAEWQAAVAREAELAARPLWLRPFGAVCHHRVLPEGRACSPLTRGCSLVLCWFALLPAPAGVFRVFVS